MVLREAPIRKVTERANPKFYRKRQSKNLPDFVIQNEKKRMYSFYIRIVLSLHNIVGCRKKNLGVQEKTACAL